MLHAELSDVGLFGSIPRYGDLCIHAAIDLRRSFSRVELERAAQGLIAAFPVLGRRYEARFWRDRWAEVAGSVADVVHVIDEPGDLEAATSAWSRRSLDVTRERPFRLVSLRRPQGSRLILTISHMAVDGAGVAAVGHVLGAQLYGVPTAAPVDPRRGVGSALERLRWIHAPALARDLAATLSQPLRTWSAARRERPYPAEATAPPSFLHLVISAAELAALKARCAPRGATINDVLVAALARASAERSSGGPVSVLYTMDLRRYAASPRLSAANTSAILTVVVPREATSDLAEAAGAVAAVTQRHRRGLAGPAFVVLPLALAALQPHGLVRRFVGFLHPFVVDLPVGRGLFVTNVGRVDDGLGPFAGDVEDVQIIGPNLRGLPIPAVVAYGFRGALHLQLFAAPGLAGEALTELAAELRRGLELAA